MEAWANYYQSQASSYIPITLLSLVFKVYSQLPGKISLWQMADDMAFVRIIPLKLIFV